VPSGSDMPPKRPRNLVAFALRGLSQVLEMASQVTATAADQLRISGGDGGGAEQEGARWVPVSAPDKPGQGDSDASGPAGGSPRGRSAGTPQAGSSRAGASGARTSGPGEDQATPASSSADAPAGRGRVRAVRGRAAAPEAGDDAATGTGSTAADGEVEALAASNVRTIQKRVGSLTPAQLGELRRREASGAERKTVFAAIDRAEAEQSS